MGYGALPPSILYREERRIQFLSAFFLGFLFLMAKFILVNKLFAHLLDFTSTFATALGFLLMRTLAVALATTVLITPPRLDNARRYVCTIPSILPNTNGRPFDSENLVYIWKPQAVLLLLVLIPCDIIFLVISAYCTFVQIRKFWLKFSNSSIMSTFGSILSIILSLFTCLLIVLLTFLGLTGNKLSNVAPVNTSNIRCYYCLRVS